MGVMKPLTTEEVGITDVSLNFDKQWTEINERGKTRAYVEGKCPMCQMVKAIPINDIRNHLRGIRSKMPGTCRGCKYPGRVVTTEGYVHIWMPDHPNAYSRRYVPEHMYVMSEHLGRPIDTKNESVHHINGDKADNRIENLQLRTRYHGKGQKRVCGDCGSHNIVTEKI